MEIIGLIIFFGIIGLILSGVAKLLPETKEEKLKKQKELLKKNKRLELEIKRTKLGITRPKTWNQHFPKIKYFNMSCEEIVRPCDWDDIKNKIGKCEYHFLNFLKKYIDNEKISMRKFKCKWYYPDMVYADFEKEIFIDIEIDEPYSFAGESIHTNEDDDDRDKKITQLGWTIIRFSEKQIALYPKECCKKISELIRYLTLDSEKFDNLKSLNDLEFDREWNSEKSTELFKSKYRDTYLGKITTIDKLL